MIVITNNNFTRLGVLVLCRRTGREAGGREAGGLGPDLEPEALANGYSR